MKNYVEFFAPAEPVKNNPIHFEDRYKPVTYRVNTGWSDIGIAMLMLGIVSFIVVFAVFLNWMPMEEGELWDWPSWGAPVLYIMTAINSLAIVARWTNAQQRLTPTQHAAFRIFSSIDREGQSELGGRRGFYRSLVGMSDDEAAEVAKELTAIKAAEDEAAEIERKMRSAHPDVLARLQSVKAQRTDFTKSMKELL